MTDGNMTIDMDTSFGTRHVSGRVVLRGAPGSPTSTYCVDDQGLSFDPPVTDMTDDEYNRLNDMFVRLYLDMIA